MPRSRSLIGRMIERESSTVSSKEIVNATAVAMRTSMPRSRPPPASPPDRAEARSAVMMLIIGSVPSSFRRSGIALAARCILGETLRLRSISTGRIPVSSAK